MKNSRRFFWVKFGILSALATLIKLVSLSPALVENAYSAHIYPAIAMVLRLLTAWLPISVGDVLYAAAILWLLVRAVKLVKLLIRRQNSWAGFWQGVANFMLSILTVYILFYALWGLNYSRRGISYQLQLTQQRYTTADLKHVTALLVEKVNSQRSQLGDSLFTYPPIKTIYGVAALAYDSAAKQNPFLQYRHACIKNSLFGTLNNYFGFLGYYNPFTGEAQVNTKVPSFIIPYTACHEIAHQVGYGSESEANFVGYLAAKASGNHILLYSTYADLFSYANSELYVRDSSAARANFYLLDTLVKQDYRQYRKFMLSYKNPIEPVLRLFYGQYLKANNQPKGIDTYNEVVAWIIAYEKKYGNL